MPHTDPVTAALQQPRSPHYATDEQLLRAGWATGLNVLAEMYDIYADAVGDAAVAHAQLRSLLDALSTRTAGTLR